MSHFIHEHVRLRSPSLHSMFSTAHCLMSLPRCYQWRMDLIQFISFSGRFSSFLLLLLLSVAVLFQKESINSKSLRAHDFNFNTHKQKKGNIGFEENDPLILSRNVLRRIFLFSINKLSKWIFLPSSCSVVVAVASLPVTAYGRAGEEQIQETQTQQHNDERQK